MDPRVSNEASAARLAVEVQAIEGAAQFRNKPLFCGAEIPFHARDGAEVLLQDRKMFFRLFPAVDVFALQDVQQRLAHVCEERTCPTQRPKTSLRQNAFRGLGRCIHVKKFHRACRHGVVVRWKGEFINAQGVDGLPGPGDFFNDVRARIFHRLKCQERAYRIGHRSHGVHSVYVAQVGRACGPAKVGKLVGRYLLLGVFHSQRVDAENAYEVSGETVAAPGAMKVVVSRDKNLRKVAVLVGAATGLRDVVMDVAVLLSDGDALRAGVFGGCLHDVNVAPKGSMTTIDLCQRKGGKCPTMPINAPTEDDEQRAVHGVDFHVLLGDPLRKDILRIFVEKSQPLTCDDVALDLKDHTDQENAQLSRVIEGMRQLGVLTAVHNGSRSFALSSAMSVELQKHLSVRVAAPDMATLPKNVQRLLNSSHMRKVRVALEQIVEGDERAVAQQILLRKMPMPIPQQRLESLAVTVRTALYKLVQYGFAAVTGGHSGKDMRFRYLDGHADHRSPSDDSLPLMPPDIAPTQPTAEELTLDTIEQACLQALQHGPLKKDVLCEKVRRALGVPVQDARISKALVALVADRAVVRRQKALSLYRNDHDDDDVPAAGSDRTFNVSMQEVAKRVAGYLKEWKAQQPDDDKPFVEGPRTAEVRLNDYIAACKCANEQELARHLQSHALDPYDLFVAHQEHCDHLLALQLETLSSKEALKKFRKRHGFTVTQTQNLAALFPADDERHAHIAKSTKESVAMLHPDVVRRYLKKALPVQYRERVL